MSIFQEKLKAFYAEQDKIAPLIEGLEEEIPPQTFKDYYIEPKMIIKVDHDRKQQNYELITDIEMLFDPLTNEGDANQHPICKLLIEGEPGVGKTTSMQYFAYKWSQGELWKDKFDYVYRVPLKTLLNRDWNQNSGRQGEDEEDDILKCLVRHHLSTEERKLCFLREIPWKMERTLLLIDGYDEVAHDKKHQKVLKEIFNHQNIILASRPNAIDKKMAKKFERKIENTGFDHNGINQYLTRYFKNEKVKGLTLEEYLEKNPFINEICHVPAIMAILCFIWREGGSSQALRKVSNLSDLYHQMIYQIGFRNYAKQQQYQEELPEKWKGGTLYLNELKVLQHLAFKRMTCADISQKSKLQTFPATDDQDDISIQSSIDYLTEVLQKEMPTIKKICKLGLLKSEGFSLKEENLSETDETKMIFSFTHFSFQEFLTARYFAEMMNKNNYTALVNFLTRHRNEPRYLMTLKFLAGILSVSRGEKAEQNIKIFWDAVMCNPDGVIELGVETKISLLMHLLSQTRKGNKIDWRTPHLNEAIELIDSVVLGDLSGWKTQLRESDYTSDNIREGLIEHFVNDKEKWVYEKSLELKKKINSNLKSNSRGMVSVSLDDIIDIIGRMIHKFHENEIEQIFSKALKLLRNYNETEWPKTKRAIELMTKIHRRSNIEDDNKKQLLHSLLKTLHDDNLNEISAKAIKELIQKPWDSLLAQTLLEAIRESLEDITTEAQYLTMWRRVKLGRLCGLCDGQLIQEILNVVVKLSKSSNQGIGMPASKNLIQFVEMLDKDENYLVRHAVVNLLLPILNDSKYHWKIKMSTSKTIKKIMKFSDKADIQLFQSVLNAFKSLLENLNRNLAMLFLRNPDITIELSRRIRKLVLMTCHHHNTQLVQDTFEIFKKLLQESDALIKAVASNNIVELIKKEGCRSDVELSRNVLDTLILLFKNPNSLIHALASANLMMLLKVETSLIEKAIDGLIRVLEDPEDDVRHQAFETISKLCKNNGVQFAQDVLNKLIKYWEDANVEDGKKRELRIMIELLKITGKNNKELVNKLVKILPPFLKDLDSGNRASAITCLTEVAKGDIGLVLKTIQSLKLKLKDSELNVRKTASKSILSLVKENIEGYPQLADETIKDLLTFSSNSEWKVKTSVVDIIGGLQSGNSEIDLVREALGLLDLLLKDDDLDIRVAASSSFLNFLKAKGRSDSDLIQKILDSLIPLLESRNSKVRMNASDNLQEVVDFLGNHFSRDVIKILASLSKEIENYAAQENGQYATAYIQKIYQFNIQELCKMKNNNSFEALQGIFETLSEPFSQHSHNDPNLRKLVSEKIIELMILGNPSDNKFFQKVVGIFELLLSNPDWESISLASKSLIEVMKRSNKQEPRLVQKLINILTHFLGDDYGRDVRSSASHHLIEIMETCGSSCENDQLRSEIFKILKAHLKVRNPSLNRSTSRDLIKLALIKTDHVNKFDIRAVMEMLIQAPCACDFDQDTTAMISNGMTALLKAESKNDARLLSDIIDELGFKLKFTNKNLVELSSRILESAFLTMLEHPDNLQQYFIHYSIELRDALTSSLRSCLKVYVQNFQSLDKLFQDPKSSLKLENMIGLFDQVPLTERVNECIQRDLDYLQKHDFPDEYVSNLKILLASELDKIGSLKGPLIIKLALIITSKEKEYQDNSEIQELIELAQKALNSHVKYLPDSELAWIYDHHDQLLSLCPEARSFERKICDKMLEDKIITSLEEQLMTKFINQGLTISFTKDEEVICEETCCKLKGKDIVEKIVKTIIKQKQDFLALQYEVNEPLFAKSFPEGMKEAAADKKEVKSVVDPRFLLKNDSWLLTILNPKKSASDIVLLEHRSAFGDHFLFHLSDSKVLSWYPDEVPSLEDIFGYYVQGEFYRGEIKELSDEDGQKLLESKDKNLIYQIQGKLVSNKIYFQQGLLRKGSEDRDQWTGENLDMKLDNKRKVFENYLESLPNLLDLEKKKIQEYYEGLVSNFGKIYISSLAISDRKIAIDDKADYLILSNLLKQLCSLVPFGIGSFAFDNADAIRAHLKATPIWNKANFVTDIVMDTGECCELAGTVALNIISDLDNRKRIFDAKEEDQQATSWFGNIKSWVLKKFEELKNKVKDYPRLRHAFEDEIQKTPAFQLGINDANRIVSEWIRLKEKDRSLHLDLKTKCEMFSKIAVI